MACGGCGCCAFAAILQQCAPQLQACWWAHAIAPGAQLLPVHRCLQALAVLAKLVGNVADCGNMIER